MNINRVINYSIPNGDIYAKNVVQTDFGYKNVTDGDDNSWPIALNSLLIERFTRNCSIDGPWYYILIFMYSVLIVIGAVGNLLVVLAVVRNPIMRTARNLFILNLAISDLLLCVITMPLTLIEILSKYWPFPSYSILCKMIAMLQAMSIYVSTISIAAIALYRFQVIVHSPRDNLQIITVIFVLIGIWLLGILLSSPIFIYKRLIYADIPPILQDLGIRDVLFCIEDWPVRNGRLYYSMFALCVQYLLPILVVSAAYFAIYRKLQNRLRTAKKNNIEKPTQRKLLSRHRLKRTNCLLISIAVIFGISWLPLNFYNLYADLKQSAFTNYHLVIYAFCHMCGMSSACSNPLLYGWLNTNFRKEFLQLL